MNLWPQALIVSLLLPFTAATSLGQVSDVSLKPAYTMELLDKQTGGLAIAGAADDSFFSKLHPREAATMTGVPRGNKSREESQNFARSFFRDAVLEFSDDEAKTIRTIIYRLNEKYGDRYPLLIRRPWRFIKSRQDLCGSFSFTRGDCIVISERTIRSFAISMERAESLFLHEQMHVLQREQPELFVSLYQDICGFRKAKVQVNSWIDERQVTNPDGIDDNWVFDIKSDDAVTTYWIGTILNGEKPLHRMGRDFNTITVPLQASSSGYVMAADNQTAAEFKPLAETTEVTSTLPLPPGYDHVNEVGAYLFTSITHNRPRQPNTLSQRAAEVLEKSKEWFLVHFKSKDEKDTDENKSGT